VYIDDYLKKKNKKKPIIKVFLSKFLLLTLIFLVTVISIKKDDNIKTWLDKNILSKNFSFTEIKNIYTKYLGGVLPFDNLTLVEPVFSEKLEYKSINKYKDGISLTVNNNYLVPVQYSGIVIFVGEKEGYGKTVIIESEEVTIWYSNVNSNIKLYDEVKDGEYLGETIDNKLYLLFQKDGNIVDYKDYI
jgi:stage IV sporulation protein FA